VRACVCVCVCVNVHVLRAQSNMMEAGTGSLASSTGRDSQKYRFSKVQILKRTDSQMSIVNSLLKLL